MATSKKNFTTAKRLAFAITITVAAFSLFFIYLLSEKHTFKPTLPYGVVLFVTPLLYLWLIRKYRRRKKILAQPFPTNWEAILNTEVPQYVSLTQQQKEQFKKELQIFLSEKNIVGIDTEVDDQIKILVAASAIIPTINYPEWEYNNLEEILIYPGNFNENFGFNSGETNILGMVGIGSSMILSKPALINGFKNFNDKQNVGLHEFLHKVDDRDGLCDGVPLRLLNSKKMVEEWRTIVKKERELLDNNKSDINPYANTNDAEFFAVAGEYFFENPSALKAKHPELYVILRKIFRQDTRSMYSQITRSLFKTKGKKMGRNSPCPCGSGRKYKHCCLRKKR